MGENYFTINADEIMHQRLVTSMGLDKYAVIMKTIQEKNIAEDIEFQRVFNGFYGIRRNAEWRRHYYDTFEKLKNTQTTFEEILKKINEFSKSIEASFSSKMYATLYPDKPVWDQYILKNLRLRMPESGEDRLEIAIDLYDKIERWYKGFLQTGNAQECLKIFDEMLPEYSWITDIKKFDFYIWSIR